MYFTENNTGRIEVGNILEAEPLVELSIGQEIRPRALLHTLVAHHTHRMGFSVEHKAILVTFLDLPRGVYK